MWSGEESGITVEFVADGEGLAGTITLFGERSFALNDVSFGSPQVHFEFGGGEVVFEGELEGETISGVVMEGRESGSFTLTRVE